MLQYQNLAVRNRIQTNLISEILGNPKAATCEITGGGRPTVPYQGLVFFSVHTGRIENEGEDGGYYLSERYYFKVTISMKTANVPQYRIGDISIDNPDSGLQLLNDYVKSVLHNSLDLPNEANDLMLQTYPAATLFITECPIFMGSDEPKEQTASWFGASKEDRGTIAGLSLTSTYKGLKLIRPIEDLLPQRLEET